MTTRAEQIAARAATHDLPTTLLANRSEEEPPDLYRRIRLRNDLPNPRGVARTNVATNTGAGATNVTPSDQADVRFDSVPGAGNGHSVTLTADYPGAFQFHQLSFGGAVMDGRPTPQVVFGRVRVVVEAAPAGTTLRCWLQTTGGTGKGKVVKTVENVTPGQVIELEGLMYGGASNTGAAILAEVMNGSAGGHVSLTAGRAQIVADPGTECPAYVDGTVAFGSWDGAANASTSAGWGGRSTGGLKYVGFSANSTYAPDHPLNASEESLLAIEAGANMVRIGLDPSSVEDVAGGRPDWRAPGIAWFSDLMDAFRSKGLKACPIIGVAPSWMTTDGAPTNTWPLRTLNDAYVAEWTQIYVAMIDEWPDVIAAVEFFNEPNLEGVWGAVIDPATYTKRLIQMSQAIKLAHPHVTFVGPALAKYQADDAQGMSVLTFLQAFYDAGGKDHVDAISVHPYGDTPGTGTTEAGSPTGFNTGHDQIMTQVRRVKKANGDDAKPIWITEYGGDTANAGWTERTHAQAIMLVRGMYERRVEYGVEALFIHTLIDRPSVVANMGVLNKTSKARRLAFRGLARGALPGGEWVNNPMSGTWTPYATGKPGLQYKILDNGDVQVRAQVKGGAAGNSPIGILPFKPKPDATDWFPGAALSGATYVMALIQINSDGTIFAAAGGSTTLTVFNFTFTPEA